MRFDGYAWLKARARREAPPAGGHAEAELMERFFTDFVGREDYARPVEELLFVLFTIQRWYLRENDLEWDEQLARVARRLFFETCTVETPLEFRYDDFQKKWEEECVPRLPRLIAFVKRRAAETAYESLPVIAKHFRGAPEGDAVVHLGRHLSL